MSRSRNILNAFNYRSTCWISSASHISMPFWNRRWPPLSYWLPIAVIRWSVEPPTLFPPMVSLLISLIGVVFSIQFILYAILIPSHRCLIVKTDAYNKEQIGKVVQLRANVEGLKLGAAVVENLSIVGEKSSLR